MKKLLMIVSLFCLGGLTAQTIDSNIEEVKEDTKALLQDAKDKTEEIAEDTAEYTEHTAQEAKEETKGFVEEAAQETKYAAKATGNWFANTWNDFTNWIKGATTKSDKEELIESKKENLEKAQENLEDAREEAEDAIA